MAIILNVDTATESASICLSKDGEKILLYTNNQQKDHASWLHVAIDEMMKATGYGLKDLDAIAVTEGPGSYTGIRVGMATAKGLCYALGIPFLTINMLKLMAFAAVQKIPKSHDALVCPMIDARRLEVFTAVYKLDMTELMPACAFILDEDSFSAEIQSKRIFFFGSGSKKWKEICKLTNADFIDITVDASHLGLLSYKMFSQSEYADLRLSMPVYLKEFFFHTKK